RCVELVPSGYSSALPSIRVGRGSAQIWSRCRAFPPLWYRQPCPKALHRNPLTCIAAVQSLFDRGAMECVCGPRGLGAAVQTVIRCPGLPGRVAEWQTRWLQVPVSFGTWGFKSPFAHNEQFHELRALRSRTRKRS
ncbi:MAG: hypothetical protein QG597_620, partial [Actinomycetota bacterium]|nr:hypothetical protein [Actinomycetota bacterium]